VGAWWLGLKNIAEERCYVEDAGPLNWQRPLRALDKEEQVQRLRQQPPQNLRNSRSRSCPLVSPRAFCGSTLAQLLCMHEFTRGRWSYKNSFSEITLVTTMTLSPHLILLICVFMRTHGLSGLLFCTTSRLSACWNVCSFALAGHKCTLYVRLFPVT